MRAYASRPVAEGVETQQGCTEMQGCLYSRPMPARELIRLLSSRREKAISAA
jgi:EAL domain-containing protein (putative c-di-GMP-specific phosphodiesterase class I)